MKSEEWRVESGEWSAEGFGNRQAPDDLTELIGRTAPVPTSCFACRLNGSSLSTLHFSPGRAAVPCDGAAHKGRNRGVPGKPGPRPHDGRIIRGKNPIVKKRRTTNEHEFTRIRVDSLERQATPKRFCNFCTLSMTLWITPRYRWSHPPIDTSSIRLLVFIRVHWWFAVFLGIPSRLTSTPWWPFVVLRVSSWITLFSLFQMSPKSTFLSGCPINTAGSSGFWLDGGPDLAFQWFP